MIAIKVCPKCGKNMIKWQQGEVRCSLMASIPVLVWRCKCGHSEPCRSDIMGITDEELFDKAWESAQEATDVPLSVKEAQVESVIGIYVRDSKCRVTGKDLLLLALYDQFSTDKFFSIKDNPMVYFNPLLPILVITLLCGEYVVYRSLEEIPEESVPCSCGDPNHWFIKYE